METTYDNNDSHSYGPDDRLNPWKLPHCPLDIPRTQATTGSPRIYGLDEIGTATSCLIVMMVVWADFDFFRLIEIGSFDPFITSNDVKLQPFALKLPDLETFQYGALEYFAHPETLTASSIDLVAEHNSSDDELEPQDPWSLDLHVIHDPPRNVIARTWEEFQGCTTNGKMRYISEAGPRVWDAVVRLSERGTQEKAEAGNDTDRGRERKEGLIVSQDDGAQTLWMLGIGLQSRLLTFGELEACHASLNEMTLSGLSNELTNSLIKEFQTIGNLFRSMAGTAKHIYTRKGVCPTKIALAETINKITSCLKEYLTREALRRKSLLQLRELFRQPGLIMRRVDSIMEKAKLLDYDEAILDEVYRFAQECEEGDAWFQPIARQILGRISRPWLDALEACLGLRCRGSVNGPLEARILGMVKQESGEGETQDTTASLPKLFGGQDGDIILQTCQSLEFLKNHDSGNVLARPQKANDAGSPGMDWKFGLEDIERIQSKVEIYRDRMIGALKNNNQAMIASDAMDLEPKDVESFNPFGTSVEHIDTSISLSYETFGHLPTDSCQSEATDAFNQALAEVLSQDHSRAYHTSFSPPLSLSPSISFSPILSIQSRLINFSCLRTLFTTYNLLHHFRLQYAFQLLGSGTFATRLANALFSPTLSSTERRKGHHRAGTLGLRLGSRSTWPPASSELRLALMGILTESYAEEFPVQPQPQSSIVSSTNASAQPLPLPSSTTPISPPISFAIRAVSEPEIRACMDPSSLQALDFLRLQYGAPSPLSTIITHASLDKYDRIFKLLLRISRVLYVATQTSASGLRRGRKERSDRSSSARKEGKEEDGLLGSRTRLEMLRFVSAVASYFHASIQTAWSRFEGTVETLTAALEAPDALERLGEGDGMHRLRALHESMLEEMLFALLLRKRQEPVMAVLEEILGLVLEFAEVEGEGRMGESRGGGAQDGGGRRAKMTELHKRFGKKVGVFVAVCKGLSEKGGGAGPGSKGGSPFGREAGIGSVGHDGRGDGGVGIGDLVLRLSMNGWYERKSS